VFEGDTLVLRCQRRGKEKLIAVKYIWNGKILYNSSKRLDFFIPRASLNNSGNYQCIGSCDKIHVSKSNSKVIKIQGKPSFHIDSFNNVKEWGIGHTTKKFILILKLWIHER
jgi:hypothetical protein